MGLGRGLAARASALWLLGELAYGGGGKRKRAAGIALKRVVIAWLGNSLIGRTREIVSAMTTVLPAVELRDAQWMASSGRAERLENRFQGINFLVFDFGEMRVVGSAASGGAWAYSTSSTRTRA